MLEISYRALSREIRRKWKGSLAIDATPILSFARGPEQSKDKTAIVRHSADPDAGYYVRPEDRDRRKPKVHWAREASLAIMGSDDPLNDRAFPYLIVAMAPLHVPGSEPGMNGVEALRWLADRKRPKHLVATDNAYVNSLPEKYQLPMRALGYEMLTDYRIDQLGRQVQYAGAVLVEGAF